MQSLLSAQHDNIFNYCLSNSLLIDYCSKAVKQVAARTNSKKKIKQILYDYTKIFVRKRAEYYYCEYMKN